MKALLQGNRVKTSKNSTNLHKSRQWPCFPCASTHPECLSGAFLASTHRGQQKMSGVGGWYREIVQGAHIRWFLWVFLVSTVVSMVLLRGSVVRLIGNSRRGQLPVTESVVFPYHHISWWQTTFARNHVIAMFYIICMLELKFRNFEKNCTFLP